MTRHFSILFLAFCAVITGCSRQNAPAFHNRKSQTVCIICQDIAEKKYQEALQEIQKLDPEDAFTVEAELAVQRRQDAEKISGFLSRLDLTGLRNFIQTTAATRRAGTDMLAGQALPAALQALQLFAAKMPYEDAQTLANGLASLEPYRRILEQSPAFCTMETEQLRLLGRLRQQDARRQDAAFLIEAETDLLLGKIEHLQRRQMDFLRPRPDHLYAGWLAKLEEPDDGLPESASALVNAERDFCTLAVISQWHRIPAAQRERWVAVLCASSSGILQEILRARHTGDYLPLLQMAQQKNMPVSGELFREFLAETLTESAKGKIRHAIGKKAFPLNFSTILPLFADGISLLGK